MTTHETSDALLLMLARMRDTAALLTRAEESLIGASEYIETDDVELLVGVAERAVDRIIGRLEFATGQVEVGEGIELVVADRVAGHEDEVAAADFEARR